MAVSEGATRDYRSRGLHVRGSSGLLGIFGIHIRPVPEWLGSEGLSGVFIYLYRPEESPNTVFLCRPRIESTSCA
jgi:hypothetical protein